MKLYAEFSAGSRVGERLVLEEGQSLTLGRSRSCDVKLVEQDISGRHLKISFTRDGLLAENLSMRQGRTFVNGEVMDAGQSAVVCEGDEIGLGDNVRLRVVPGAQDASDGTPTMIDGQGEVTVPPVADEPTRIPAPRIPAEAVQSPEMTLRMNTLKASDEEFARINADIQAKRRLRTFMWMAPVVIVLASLVSLYVMLRPKPEEFTSWPVDAAGSFREKPLLLESYLALMYPNVPGCSLSTNEQGVISVRSALGQMHDIPLNIEARVKTDMSELSIDHADSFDRFLMERSESDTTFSPTANKVHRFISTNRSAGVPLSYLSYTRRDGADEFFGYMVFIRQAATAFAISIEVPLAEQWRAENFIMRQIGHFVIYANKRVAEHWEGCSWYRRETSVETDLLEARKFLAEESPLHWESVFFRLESALVKAYGAGRTAEVEEALRMLVLLRDAQTIWYNQQKLSYLAAKVSGRKETMLSIQSQSESAFTPIFQDFDFRYEQIKRRDWR